jgi:hypothetical protein
VDSIDLFIAFLHSALGHDKTADYLGVPRYDKRNCMLCNPSINKEEECHSKPGMADGAQTAQTE